MTDPLLATFFGGILAFLAFATLIGQILKWRASSEAGRKTVENLNARIFAWWLIVLILALGMYISRVSLIVLFAIVSFLALREFVTITPTRRGDHRALFWAFFIILPLNYLFIAMDWYGMWSIFVPVYGFLFIPLRSALAGDCERFLERNAKIQWALMIAVYAISHAPAILLLRIPGYQHSPGVLLLYFLLVVQLSDVLQYVWGKLLGRYHIAPTVSPNKTWEGFVGGILSATLIGAALHSATPFGPLWAFVISLLTTLMGFAGGLVMSAVKRDLGVKDYGSVLPGHGGIMDRLDSVAFAAPIFFHVVRYYYTP